MQLPKVSYGITKSEDMSASSSQTVKSSNDMTFINPTINMSCINLHFQQMDDHMQEEEFLSQFGLVPTRQTDGSGNWKDVSTAVDLDLLDCESGSGIKKLKQKLPVITSGGDSNCEQIQTQCKIRHLLGLPISSPLGRRLTSYITCTVDAGDVLLNPCTVAHTLFGIDGVPEYGAFCRTPIKSTFSGRLRRREYKVRYRNPGVGEHCHRYCFTRADRENFCRRFDIGLNDRSRNLQKHYGHSSVKLHRLKPEEIADWRSSKRLRDVVNSPRRELYMNTNLNDEIGSKSQDCINLMQMSESELNINDRIMQTANGVKLPREKAIPAILKRNRLQAALESSETASSLKSDVITLSSDSDGEDQPPSAAVAAEERFIFHCHKCGAEIPCNKQFRSLVKAHYLTSHNIGNIDLQYHQKSNGETTLSVVQLPQQPLAGKVSQPSPPFMPLPSLITPVAGTTSSNGLHFTPVQISQPTSNVVGPAVVNIVQNTSVRPLVLSFLSGTRVVPVVPSGLPIPNVASRMVGPANTASVLNMQRTISVANSVAPSPVAKVAPNHRPTPVGRSAVTSLSNSSCDSEVICLD